MANDNILAGIAGLAEGAQSVLVPWLQNQQKAKIQSELQSQRDYQSELPIETVSAITGRQFPNLAPGTRIDKALIPYLTKGELNTTSILDEKGEVINQVKGSAFQLKTSEEDKAKAKADAKLKSGQAQAKIRLNDAIYNLDSLEKEAKDILNSRGLGYATGILSPLGKIPGTPAKNISARINTLRSKTAFNALQAMRESSKTGGALGQVSDRENMMLENNVTALDTGQSTPAFKDSLNRLILNTRSAKERLKNAYSETYGSQFDGSDNASDGSNDPLGLGF